MHQRRRRVPPPLAECGDADDVALTLGGIAGLGEDEAGRTTAFPAMAAELLRITDDPTVRWRANDFGTDDLPPGARWTATLPAGTVTIDQRDLRIWTRTSTETCEVHAPDPITRLHRAVELLGYQPSPAPAIEPLATVPRRDGRRPAGARARRSRPGPRTIALPALDEARCLSAIDRLRASHSRATSMADALEAAVRSHAITEDAFARHTRWCHTEGTFAAGVDPARDAARAMYGFIPERLRTEDGKAVPDAENLLAGYRRRVERT